MDIQAIRVRGPIEEKHRPVLTLGLRLMTAAESIRSAWRGIARLSRTGAPAEEADRYYLLFAAVGAAGEAIKVIREGGTAGTLRRSWIEKDAALANTWDNATAPSPSRLLEIARRVRNKYWAHWDPDIASQFVAGLTGTDADPPMIESSGQGQQENTSHRWVRVSWFVDLEREFDMQTEQDAQKAIQDMMNFVLAVADLAGSLITPLFKENGLTLEFVPAPSP